MFGGGGIGGERQQRIAFRVLVAEHDLAILVGQHLAEAGEQRAIGRAGDRGGPEFGRDQVAGIVVQVVRPCRMAVPRQDDRTRAGTPEALVEPFAGRRIAVPRIEAEGDADAVAGERPGQPVAICRRNAGKRRGVFFGTQRLFQIGAGDARHYHLIAEQLPRLVRADRAGQHVLQPALLLRAEHLAVGAGGFGQGGGIIAGRGRLPLGCDLFAAREQPGLHHRQRCQVAELEAAEDGLATQPATRFTDRHPFEIGLHRRRLARGPVALGRRVVVLRAADPAVIGDLVIVPHADKGGAGVGGLHVRIALHLCMAAAIVGQRDDLVRRIGQAVQLAADVRAVPPGAIFIDIVAEMENRVEPGQRRHVGIGVEQAAGI